MPLSMAFGRSNLRPWGAHFRFNTGRMSEKDAKRPTSRLQSVF
jgi:hypothetical protein